MRFLSYLFSKNPHSFCILGRLEKQMIPSFVERVVSKNLHSQGVKLGKQTY